MLPHGAPDRYDVVRGEAALPNLHAVAADAALPGAVAAGAVVAVGVDVVSVSRFGAALKRTPALAGRLMTAAEQVTNTGRPRTTASLAARFAAKEAVSKALGAPRGLDWHDCVIESGDAGRPAVALSGTVAAAAVAQGITRFELSLTHDAGIAAAIVVAVR